MKERIKDEGATAQTRRTNTLVNPLEKTRRERDEPRLEEKGQTVWLLFFLNRWRSWRYKECPRRANISTRREIQFSWAAAEDGTTVEAEFMEIMSSREGWQEGRGSSQDVVCRSSVLEMFVQDGWLVTRETAQRTTGKRNEVGMSTLASRSLLGLNHWTKYLQEVQKTIFVLLFCCFVSVLRHCTSNIFLDYIWTKQAI